MPHAALSVAVRGASRLSVEASSSAIRNAYKTLNETVLCSARCVFVKVPAPELFDIDHLHGKQDIFTHNTDDVLTEEIEYSKASEYRNRFRLNKFLGGRIALR